MASEKAVIKYFPALDGLRGAMAIAVIIVHVNRDWFPGAPIVMDVFFVISGFLISMIIQKEIQKTGTLSILRFWQRRLTRLYPALLVVVACSLLMASLLIKDMSPVLYDALSSIFYYSNWTKIYNYVYPGMFGHTWSLSVEEQFYLLWPVFFVLTLQLNLRKIHTTIILLLIACVSILWRIHLIDQGVPWSRVYYALETRMDAFVAGGVLALHFDWLRARANALKWHALLNLCALALAILFITGRPFDINYFLWQQPLAIILSMAAILLLTSSRENFLKRFFSGKLCVFLGVRCYSFYLWHWPIIWLLLMTTELPKLTMLMIAFTSTLLLSSLTYKFVEAPFLSHRTSTSKDEKATELASSSTSTGNISR